MEIDVDSLSFDEAFKKLEEIVKILERGDCLLEEAMKYYDLGIALKNKCSSKLQVAKGKIEQVVDNGKGVEEFHLN